MLTVLSMAPFRGLPLKHTGLLKAQPLSVGVNTVDVGRGNGQA